MSEIIPAMVLPCEEFELLVPTRLVAEILKFDWSLIQAPKSKLCVGEFEWQGFHIPLIELPLSDTIAKQSNDGLMAILKALSLDQQFAFIGLGLKAQPYLVKVEQLDIQSYNSGEAVLPGFDIQLNHRKLKVVDLFSLYKEVDKARINARA